MGFRFEIFTPLPFEFSEKPAGPLLTGQRFPRGPDDDTGLAWNNHVRSVRDRRADVLAEQCHRTDDEQGDQRQQQGVLSSRGTFFFSHKPTNCVQHGMYLSLV